jgi:hypothetical protein
MMPTDGRFAGLAEAADVFAAEAETMPAVIAAQYSLKPEDARAWCVCVCVCVVVVRVLLAALS